MSGKAKSLADQAYETIKQKAIEPDVSAGHAFD